MICKTLSDAAVRKMFNHGQEFVHACHRRGLVPHDATRETPQIVLARLMAGHLCIDHYARKIGVRKYPLWRELESSTASLLDMMLKSMTEDHEAAAYAVAEEMVIVVAPATRRKA